MDNKNIPQDGIAGLKENWKTDILSGFIVSLIALPLCIAIAKASGAPAIAGLFAGIIGGIIVSLISGSYVTINGPAAGLIVIIFHSVDVLGNGDNVAGFKYTCAAILFAGVLQVIFGALKLGKLSSFFPTSAIHGMMAAIGIIIISKQVPLALGVDPTAKSIIGLIAEIPKDIINMNPEIASIGVISILILVIFQKLKSPIMKKIPAPLIVVIVALIMGVIYQLSTQHPYEFLGKEYVLPDPKKSLVVLPASILDGLQLPDFSLIAAPVFWVQVITIMLVGSIESILTAVAADGIDPYKRKSNMDRELLAKGTGNALLGIIGGIPIIAEVVRSKANVDNGARTRWSNFFHGLFILLFIVFLSPVIQMIPMAALAALLIMVGARLASPHAFKEAYEIGYEQLIIFLITIVLTIVEDLLVGVAMGVVAQIIINLFSGVSLGKSFKTEVTSSLDKNGDNIITIDHAAVFTNFLSIKKELDKAPLAKKNILVFKDIKVVDFTVMEKLSDFKRECEYEGGSVEFRGLDVLTPFSTHHASSSRRLIAK